MSLLQILIETSISLAGNLGGKGNYVQIKIQNVKTNSLVRSLDFSLDLCGFQAVISVCLPSQEKQ